MDSFARKCGIGFLLLLTVLLVVAAVDEPDKVDAKSLQSLKENTKVSVEGVVTNVRVLETVTLFSLKDDVGFVNLVLFDSVPSLKKGLLVRIVGRVSVYKDKKE